MFKVVLLGEGRVGKTSMIKQIMKKNFTENEISTTQASHYQKVVKLDNRNVTLDIWDTAGQEQYHALGPVYYRDADAAILVFDVTMKETFAMVKSWVKEISSTCEKDIVYVIAGNKVDLIETPQMEEAWQFARSIKGEYIETSAKTGINLDLLLLTVAKALVDRYETTSTTDMYSLSAPLLVSEEPESKKCCC
ncbi:hypothetical protein WA171_004984 [Blastocystis sp. BT1]